MIDKFGRLLHEPKKMLLLLGPRGTGKSIWLTNKIRPTTTINLLHSDKFFHYQAKPSTIREDIANLSPGSRFIIDEIQRVPELLNEIHGNCESQGIPFAITGSSARKLKRADANLLAGRALRLNFFPLVWAEIPDESRLEGCIEFGTLPSIVDSPSLAADIRWAYVETFLVEEIAAEALTRSLEAFARFINTAAQYHGQLLNIEAIARESSVKRRSADKYLHILEDTLIGFRLPAKSLGVRAKEAAHPKFYFLDAGVARAASGWLRESVPDVWQGFSFESHVLNEIRAYNSYQKKDKNIFHYSITGSFDIDFLIETNKKFLDQKPSYIAIEVKLAKTWRSEWSKLLIDFKEISDALKGFKNNMTRVEVHFHEIKRNKDSGADKYSAFEAKR